MTLGLLCDHLLLLYPEQFVRLSNKKSRLPGLVERLKMEAMIATIRAVVDSPDPGESLEDDDQKLWNRVITFTPALLRILVVIITIVNLSRRQIN